MPHHPVDAPTLLSARAPRSGKSSGIALSECPAELATALSTLDDGSGYILPQEVALAIEQRQTAQRPSVRGRQVVAITAIVVIICVCSTAVLSGASSFMFMRPLMGYQVEPTSSIMYGAKQGMAPHAVATGSALHAHQLGELPGLKASGYDYNLITSVSLDNVPPHGISLGFQVTGFVWYNASAMNLILNDGYLCEISDGHWKLHKPLPLPSVEAAGRARRELSLWSDLKSKVDDALGHGTSDSDGTSSTVKAPVTTMDTTSTLSGPFAGIGDRIVRGFEGFHTMPITVKEATGWVKMSGTCVPGLGMAYAQASSHNATKEDEPVILYFTPAGQVSGVGMYVLGNSKPRLVTDGWFIDAGEEKASRRRLSLFEKEYPRKFISVSFREASAACSSATSEEPLGDRLVVNAGPGGIAYSLPLSASAATETGWVKGACFKKMGSHYFKDLTSATLSWESENLLPISLMYDEESPGATGALNAFFFATPDRQQRLLPPSNCQWDTIPLPNKMMCQNMCASGCTFHDTKEWSTVHYFLRDYSKVSCNGRCSTS
jgi:hypothetical protein